MLIKVYRNFFRTSTSVKRCIYERYDLKTVKAFVYRENSLIMFTLNSSFLKKRNVLALIVAFLARLMLI